jgi:branched-chain amino acid transport system substrate-binding protein
MLRDEIRAVLFTAMVAIASAPGVAAAQGTIKIGVTEPLTGPVAASGNYVLEGAKIAADQINAEGGVLGNHIKLIVEDNKGDPASAASAGEKLLVRDQVPVLMGAWSSTCTLATMPMLMEYHVPLLVETSSSDKITTSGNPWVFRIAPNSRMQAEGFGKNLDAFHIKKAAFLVVDNDWGLGNQKAFSDVLKRHNIDVVLKETMGPDDQDLSSQLSSIKGSTADTLFITTEVEQLALILEQAHALQLPQRIIIASASSSPDQIIKDAGGEATDGVYAIVAFAPWFPEMSPNPTLAKAFIADWEKRHLVFAGLTEGFRGYDGIRTIAAAIKSAGKAEPDAIRQALWNVRVPGVNGNITFVKEGPKGRESGQYEANIYTVEMKGGKVIKPNYSDYSER